MTSTFSQKMQKIQSIMLSIHKSIQTNNRPDLFTLIVLLACVSLSACSDVPPSANAEAGMQKAQICGQCHGQDGISIIPIYPNLAGQKQAYMEMQLRAFRSGERINAAMTPHARRLSDQDIVDLSAYYANMDPRGKTVSK